MGMFFFKLSDKFKARSILTFGKNFSFSPQLLILL